MAKPPTRVSILPGYLPRLYKGTPVADMLAHSPPLPLIIDHICDDVDFSEEDGVGLLLALKQCRDRVRRVHLQMAIPYLHKLVLAIDEEFPILHHLIIRVPDTDTSTIMTLPKTFQAPRLQHLALIGFVLPMEPRSFAVNLVTLAFVMSNPTAYFRPNTLLQLLSFTPQLETLVIMFEFRDIDDVETRSQLPYIPITTHVTLPNLRFFGFRGRSTFTESLVYWITTPRLAKADFDLFSQDSVNISSLLRFIDTSKNLTFDSAKLEFFKWRIHMVLYPRDEVEKYAFSMKVDWLSPGYHVSYMAQLFDAPSQMFSAVEHLTLERGNYDRFIGPDNKVEWRRILRSFYNVKTLHVDGFVEELPRWLQLDDGEHPLELLPELQELTYKGGSAGDAFTSFIDARQNAGRPVTLVCRRRPYTGLLESPSETPAITLASGKTGNELDA